MFPKTKYHNDPPAYRLALPTKTVHADKLALATVSAAITTINHDVINEISS